MKKLVFTLIVALLVFTIFAEIKMDIAGKIYNQYRWTNTTGKIYWDSYNFGSFSSGSTVWPGYGRTDKKEGNFLRTEAEFEFNANVSKFVKSYMRVQTIFNSDETTGDGEHSASSWSDDWDDQRGFFKLRGFLIQVNPDLEAVKLIELGTPMGYPFNKWLLADRRYIDRDNIKAVLIRGNSIGFMTWNIGQFWNAKYMGPGWNGVNSFLTEDYTYAMNMKMEFSDALTTDVNTVWFVDRAINSHDGDLDDTMSDGNYFARADFYDLGLTLDATYNMNDEMSLDGTIIYTMQKYNDALDVNEDNIADNLSWVTQKTPPHWYGINEPYADVNTFSGILTFKSTDPFKVGFSPKAQFFYLDNNLYTPFGSRREHDMLMMHGGVDALRYTAGDDRAEGERQHQSLNAFLYSGGQSAVNEAMTDNNYLRLGEDFYESAIGYTGITLDGDMDLDNFFINGQVNFLIRTDNNDGKIDEEDDNYEGEDTANAWYYQEPRDFSAIIGDLSVKTRQLEMDWIFRGKFGNWQDVKADYLEGEIQPVGTHNIELTGMVFEFAVKKQLFSSVSLEINPRYQSLVFNEEGTDFQGAEYDNEYTNSDIVINEKLVYNFGGFDFWLRGEHFIKSLESDLSDETLNLGWTTIHAAFEVKF